MLINRLDVGTMELEVIAEDAYFQPYEETFSVVTSKKATVEVLSKKPSKPKIVVEKIKQYTLNPTPGIWRSKVALVADDMYRSCSFDNGESSHTEISDKIYDDLHKLLPILPFYGVHYGLQQTSSGCAYPKLTRDLIRTINNGVGLVNYIGHGDPETWAGEKLISKSRDLTLIQPDDNKLAIWIAGTCSFCK